MAVSDDQGTLAVSNYGVSGKGRSVAGRVYVYTRRGAGWKQERVLIDPRGAADESFGYSVAMSRDGSTFVVGAPSLGIGARGASKCGTVYVYTRRDGAWSLQSKLQAPEPEANDSFGISVGVSGSGAVLAVGTDAHKAFVYNRSGNGWVATEMGAGQNTPFGWPVVVSGDGATLVVGCALETLNNKRPVGEATVYVRNAGHWKEQATIHDPGADGDDDFGDSVTLGDGGLALSRDGNTLAVAAGGTRVGGSKDAGKVYLYSRRGSTWRKGAVLTDPAGASGDHFGTVLAISDDGATLVAATRANGKRKDRAYLFSMPRG